MPITSCGFAMAAVNPSAKPAIPGMPRRQATYASASPSTETPSHWPSRMSSPVPNPASASSTIATRDRRANVAGQGAARATSHSENAMSRSWTIDHTRQAVPALRRLNGIATTAAAGGFSKGMSSCPAGAPLATSVACWTAGS